MVIVEVLISDRQGEKARPEVLVRVLNQSEEASEAALTLNLNGNTVKQARIALAAGEEKTATFKDMPVTSNLSSGFVEITNRDAIAVDNRYYFVWESQANSQVLAVDGEPDKDIVRDELFYLERAINFPGVSKYTLVRTTPSQLRQHDVSRYQAVLLANVNDLSSSQLDRLTSFVQRGGGMLISLGDRVNLSLFNRKFAELAPAELEKLAFQRLDRTEGAIVAGVDYQHPIFRLFADPGQTDPSVAKYYQYIVASPATPESVLASFDDGNPVLLERRVGQGKVLLFTSSLDGEWTNVPVKAHFVPMLYRMLDHIVAERYKQQSYLVGEPVLLPGYIVDSDDTDIAIELPDGRTAVLQSEYFEQTDMPGIYAVAKSGKANFAFAVNVDTRESDLTPLPQEEIANLAVTLSEDAGSTAVAAGVAVEQSEREQKLWRFTLLFVILLLLVETVLANRTHR
jgi:hypothetical protein